ncbi:MAG: hypothetical protein JWM41_2895 [Gemmatimonadetes bacterium]|nr:hypothetical protein [Gemmatimonadota bacterium]
MSDEIPPALTKEEWAKATVFGRGCDGDLSFHRADGGDIVVMEDCVHQDIRIGEASTQHAVAALLLHGQPFGFTQEMVAAVEFSALGTARKDLLPLREDGTIDMASVNALAQLAAIRIAALLPPPDVARNPSQS